MKKTLFVLAAAFCGTASAAMQVGDIVGVTFTGAQNPSPNTFATSILGQRGIINAVQVGNGASSNQPSNAGNLQTSTGVTAGITIALTNAAGCGEGGTIINYADPAQGLDPSAVFGSSVAGIPNGGCVNASNGSMTMTIGGLTAGLTYDLYVLTGRGNSYQSGNEDTAAQYTLSGADGITATVVGSSSASTNVVDATLNSYEYNAGGNNTASSWSLVKYSFTATEEGTVTLTTSDRLGNINGFVLQATPEPTTATLSLLALAGLCARRRRK